MGSDVSLSKAVRANLLSLQNTASMMDKTQNRLATGNKVNSALDNPSNFFTASALNSRAADMGNLLDAMASGIKTIEAASNGITAITKNVESMQSTLRQARQDKSFQTGTFEVTDASTLKVSGGQYADDVEIKLGTQTPGVNAAVTSSVAYTGVVPTAGTEGLGARAVFKFDATPNNDKIKIDGKEVTLDATPTAAEITTALGADATKYTITDGNGTNGGAVGEIIIENKDPLAKGPVVELGLGVVQDVKGTTTFKYDPATVGAVIAGGQNISTGTTFEEFVAGLESKAKDGKYTVSADATTKQITLTNTEYGATSPTVTGVPAYAAGSSNVNVFTVGTGAAANDTVTIDGVQLTFTTTPGSVNATATALKGLIDGNATLAAKYTVVDNGSGQLTVTSKDKAVGADFDTAMTKTGTIVLGASAYTAGAAFVDGQTSTAGTTNNARVTNVAAASDDISVTYGDKTADIKIKGMVKVGVLPTVAETATYQTNTVKDVNDQLKAQGLDNLEASFSADGKFQITAKNAEAKSIAISGDNASSIFGSKTVNTGSEAVSGYNATNTVDKFVEEINRSQAGKLRASNDNGKLRIENLSTQELEVSFDKDGAAGALSPTTSKVAGNSVRANLSKQFNELRDQLDKLADDSSFNGINLLRGDQLTITFNESGSSSIKIQAKDQNGNVRGINAANMDIASLNAEDLDTDEGIDKLLSTLSSALTELRSQASTFGSNLSSVENRQSFTKNMINTLETGASNLTLADTNEEAANLLALQTRQQLSSSALSMASQQDQAVLQLLR